jgi:steroid delta-isomerase-like uncharacterized protein
MSIERTAEIINAYLGEEGLARVAEDAVYTVMGTGREIRGRAEVGRFLDHLYAEAFEASAKPISRVVGDGGAAFEYEFKGRHIGEFEGIPATGREVTVPLCVVYSVDGEHITSAHVYFEMDSLRRQVGV